LAKAEVATPLISDLLGAPGRFLRSTYLERDFDDPSALDGYLITPFVANSLGRILDGVKPGSRLRAWRLTGDYGVGKSSFALLLVNHLARRSGSIAIETTRSLLSQGDTIPILLPVLVTGTRGGIVQAIAKGFSGALSALIGAESPSDELKKLLSYSEEIRQSGDANELVNLAQQFQESLAKRSSGTLLVVDELGKLLEQAAMQPDLEDVYVLQRLSDMAGRSGRYPFVFVVLLNQGFQAYAERLPSVQREEWQKVSGRFEELVFDQPLSHAASLVAGALRGNQRQLPTAIRKSAEKESELASKTGWFGKLGTEHLIDGGQLYPLHPTVLPVLLRFFARFGQHERSLFGFLLSSEPFGLQAYAQRKATAGNWYRLADFYDYVRAVFGHRLSSESYRTSWLRLLEVIDGIPDTNPLDERILKTVAILNLLDSEDLRPTDQVLLAAVDRGESGNIADALIGLTNQGVLFRRGSTTGYRLWPNTSINLSEAFQSAQRTLGRLDGVAQQLGKYLDAKPVLARRHYLSSGTLRYFEIRYANVNLLEFGDNIASQADGVVVVVLCDTAAECTVARAWGKEFTASNDRSIAVVPEPLLGLGPELQDVRIWKWVIENTPSLSDDRFAFAEATRQLALATNVLTSRVDGLLGFKGQLKSRLLCFRAGREGDISPGESLSAMVSQSCDELYGEAPMITNELLNRNSLSSAAAAARMRLIEGMFNSPTTASVGIDPNKTPPEKSMYLSVLAKGRIHKRTSAGFYLEEPSEDDDPLRLRPALLHLVHELDSANGSRIPVKILLDSLNKPPFGVRDGVSALLLAIVLCTRSHEIAVYEHGTFLHGFGASDFMRLVKQPKGFECQLYRVAGVRAQVFRRLKEVFCEGSPDIAERDLLSVVTPLCRFAAELPGYTLRTSGLDLTALRVRDVLLAGREPATMIFCELPVACELAPFSTDESVDADQIDLFVRKLEFALEALRTAYPLLLSRISERTFVAFGGGDRSSLSKRGAQVALIAKEVRLRSLALRLQDTRLSHDGWLESIGSLILSKPPSRWGPGDEPKFTEEIGELGETFQRIEAMTLAFGPNPNPGAVRIALTRIGGEEYARLVNLTAEEEFELKGVVESLVGLLPTTPHMRLAVISRLLWRDLGNDV